MSSNPETVQGVYDAFAQGDMETVLATFAADITWVDAEGGPYGGTYLDSARESRPSRE